MCVRGVRRTVHQLTEQGGALFFTDVNLSVFLKRDLRITVTEGGRVAE